MRPVSDDDRDRALELAHMAAIASGATFVDIGYVTSRLIQIYRSKAANREDMAFFAKCAPCLIRAIAGAWGVGVRELHSLLPLTSDEFFRLVLDGEATVLRDFEKVNPAFRKQFGYR